MASIDSTIAPSVNSVETSKEAWEYLHTTYVNRSQTRIYSLRDALAKFQRDQKFINDYLREIRTITDELAIACARISNEELVVKILCGLGPDYEALRLLFVQETLLFHMRNWLKSSLGMNFILLKLKRFNHQLQSLLKLQREQIITITIATNKTRRWSGQPQWRSQTTPSGKQQ